MNKTGSSILRVPLFRLNNIFRNISITCRGEPIQREKLFEYTNGRFLVNEKSQLSKRYVKFDLDALCRRVSSLPSVSSAVTSVEKMEGGFSKALLMIAQNGTEVVAKIPCPTIVPAKYCTASEVAVLEYVKSYTSVPVPRVLAWCCDASDPVGTEYIIMEKAKGRPLVEVWGELDQLQKFRVIQNLAYLESQLASQRFPAYGGLYFKHSIQSSRAVPVDEVFCIGPAYNASRLPQRDNEDDHAGPWTTLHDLGLSLVNCGLSRIEHPTLAPRVPHSGSKEEHTAILTATSSLIPILAEHPSLQRYAQPTLWHTDLHLGNIFVSDKDPPEIVDIIDWQFVAIKPAFTHVQWPSFIFPPEDYKIGMVAPELPSNFDEMDTDEKSFAISERDKALLSKCYEAALTKRHLVSYLALTRVDPAIRHLFTLAESTYKDGIAPLRDALIQISRNWGRMGFEGPCPYAASDDDALRHMVELARYEDWRKLQFYTQELLQSDEDGWVSPELDFDKVKARHDELFQVYMARATEEVSEEEVRRLWFYIEEEE